MSLDDHQLEDNADDQRRITGHQSPGVTAATYADALEHARSAVPPGPAPVQHRPDPEAEDLAEQLVDVAGVAAAVDQVDEALDDAATAAPDYDFAEAVAGMANRHLQEAGLALEVVEACAGCGCTNRRACVLEHPRSIGGGMHVQTCHWIQTAPGQPPRCSKCGPTDEALEAHPATLMGIRIHRDDDLPPGELQIRDRTTGETLMRIRDIEQPTAEEAQRAQVLLLVDEDEHPIPYAAAETMTAEREGDDETAREARARRRP